MLGLLLLVAGPLRAQIIDRVLAVVVGEPITLSDVTAAIRLGLVPVPAGAEDRVQVVLTALIERQLELVEVNRYVPPEPSAAQVEAGLAQVRARFDSQAALETAMRETGVSEAQLRARIRDDVRLETYLKQRFGGSYQPGEEEVARYYRSHESDFIRNGVLRPVRGSPRRSAPAARRRTSRHPHPRLDRRPAPANGRDHPAQVERGAAP